MSRWDKGDTANTIPEWFFEAVETPSVEGRVEVDECDVVYRTWGDAGKPGLLLVHGMHAHSHWWDFIAPQLLPDYQITALDLTGMGDSDFRYEYSADVFAQEITAVCDAVGFDNNVVVAAHSFGGRMALRAANANPDRFGRLILLDTGIRHPDEPEQERPSLGGRAKVYPSKEAALGRFRLYPPQTCVNEYVVQYIARNSLLPVDGGGWAWKFDDDMYTSLTGADASPADFEQLKVPTSIIYGADSDLYSAKSVAYMSDLIPQEVKVSELADSQHHLFLDQPLAFVDVLKEHLQAS